MAFSVQVAYPTRISEPLDDLLEQLANRYDGEWVASGVGFHKALGERDIEFLFVDETSARSFAEACAMVDQVRVIAGPKADD